MILGSSRSCTESSFRNGAGRLAVTGEIRFKRVADLRARFERIPLTPLLPEDWRVRLHGDLSGTARVRASLPGGDPRIEGSLQLQDGIIEAIRSSSRSPPSRAPSVFDESR